VPPLPCAWAGCPVEILAGNGNFTAAGVTLPTRTSACSVRRFRRPSSPSCLEFFVKIAAGCFGCLAFLFLIMMFATGPIVAIIANTNPDLGMTLAPLTGTISYINSGCCCFSGVLAIVFLAVGMMGGNKDADA